ncbi:NAD(P)-dependent oxidoreductase [Mycobacterium sp. 1423905.2]|uniref:NAD-dependent epimerase/dehydratase family protein n=1 Tax=Mycobacterium sp. 1423905.2 TaxID=1856859 RepID=UPI0007FBC963|nr:NAD(P)-dependent oxidoreductase [Mycobacterium sp. 1423905.2]OBJ52175.1 oxidoreductase [Mycobacterium sp. 1423905.2]
MNPLVVLVTGAYGQVGKQLVEILLSRGHHVVASDLHTEVAEAAAEALSRTDHPGKLTTVYADLLHPEAMVRIVEHHMPTAIAHLAGMYPPLSYRNPRLARRISVDGASNLIRAAQTLSSSPFVVFASSAAVYGSRNPVKHPELITTNTPTNPVDQYGEDKTMAEDVIVKSGLPYAILRLGGVISPDTTRGAGKDHLLLMRATPGNNRLHTVDSRDAGMAFANALERRETVTGRVLLIAGDDSHRRKHRDVEDDMMAAFGIGRLGESASLPGDPDDERGWSFTGWFDTSEAQELLNFQQHSWNQTVTWVTESKAHLRPVLTAIGPVLRATIRLALVAQRGWERRGPYADPWTLIEKHYGTGALAARRNPANPT